MAITIANLRISPFSQKDTIQKLVFGDEWSITVKLPTPHIAGDKYSIGLDYENTLYPPNRPLCAGTEAFTLDGDELTFTLKLGTARMRDWCSKIRKPMPMAIQIVRVRNNKAETLLLDSLLALPSVYDGVVTVCEGDAIQILLDAKLDKPAVEGTAGQILSIDENGQCVWRDEQEIPEQVQADWDESDSSDPSFIQNKPDLSVYAEKSELAPVSISGDYADLSNKPAIPTKVSDLTNDSDFQTGSQVQTALLPYSLVTETGARLSMTVDSNYDLVVSLLDKNGNVLSTQDVDLPIESMVVSASYADGTLTLTLQNGQTLDVDISDIVSGLVPETRTVNGHALSQDVTVTASDLGLATVATTGSYNDLVDTPTLPTQDELVPAATSSDAGKVLAVDSTGTPAWDNKVDEDTLDALDGMISMLETHASSDQLPYFHIFSLVDGNTISLTKQNNWYKTGGTPSLEVSIDKDNWVSFNPQTETFNVTLGAGDTLWMRGDNTEIAKDRFINATGNFKLGGKMTSLLSKTIDTTKTITYMPKFARTRQLVGFMDDFEFPYGVTNISEAFQSCSGLTMLPPILPSTVSKIFRTFEDCTQVASLPDGYTIPEACAGVANSLYVTFNNIPFTKVPDGFKIPSGCVTLYYSSFGTFDGNRVTEIGNNVEFLNDETWTDGAFPIYRVTKIGDNFKIRNANVTETDPFVLFPNLTSLGTNCDINGTITNPA